MQIRRVNWTYDEKLSFTKNYLKVKNTVLKPVEKFIYAQKDLDKDRKRDVSDLTELPWLSDFMELYREGYLEEASVEKDGLKVFSLKEIEEIVDKEQFNQKEEVLTHKEEELKQKEVQLTQKELQLKQKIEEFNLREEDLKQREEAHETEMEYFEIEKLELKEKKDAIANESSIYVKAIENAIYKMLSTTPPLNCEPKPKELKNILLVGVPANMFEEVSSKFNGVYNFINWKTSARNDFIGLKVEVDKAFRVYAPNTVSSSMNNYLRKFSGKNYIRYVGGMASTLCTLLSELEKEK